ncbi:MAG: hypothetical protein LAQ69_28485 [Acidobacteriia bacterium]|nr:hypothetical protein [Terriglobia bacterium]
MPVSMEFLRGVLGVIALGCAHMAGRSLAAVRKGSQKLSRLYGWVIRMTVCLAAVAFRHSVDMVDIAIWALAAVAFAAGFWSASHQKPPEDLTREIFPE